MTSLSNPILSAAAAAAATSSCPPPDAEMHETEDPRRRPHVQCVVVGFENHSDTMAVQSFLRGCACVYGETQFGFTSHLVQDPATFQTVLQRSLNRLHQPQQHHTAVAGMELVDAMQVVAIEDDHEHDEHDDGNQNESLPGFCLVVSIESTHEVLWSFEQVVQCIQRVFAQASSSPQLAIASSTSTSSFSSASPLVYCSVTPATSEPTPEPSTSPTRSSSPRKQHQPFDGIEEQEHQEAAKHIRLFLAGDRSQVGKSTLCLGLLGSLLQLGFHPHELGYIKPATQCEQPQLVGKFCRAIGIECCEIGPIVFYSGFTRAFLNGETLDSTQLLQQAKKRVEEIAKDKRVVIVDGVGYPAVGSICGVSNAQIAKEIGAHVVLVGRNGVGDAVDSFNLNATFFTYHGVRVLGGIFNRFARKGFYSLRNCRQSIEQYFAQYAPHFKAYGFVPDLSEDDGDEDEEDENAMDVDDAEDTEASSSAAGTTASSTSSASRSTNPSFEDGGGDYIAMDRDLKRRRGCGGHEEYDLANIGHLTLEEGQLAYRVIEAVSHHVNLEEILKDAAYLTPRLPSPHGTTSSKRPLANAPAMDKASTQPAVAVNKKSRLEIQQQARTLGAPSG